jgi:hypothetical protein
MIQIRNSKMWRRLTWLLTLAMVAGLLPVCLLPAAAEEAHPAMRTYLVMPTVDQSNAGADYLTKMLTDELTLSITSVRGMAALEFDANSPVVQRAVNEGRVLPVQVEAGSTTAAAAIQLAAVLGTDAVVMTTIENAAWSDQPRQVKLIVSGAVYPVVGNYNPQTKEVSATPQTERTFKVVGAAPALGGYQGPDRPLFRDAIRDAVRQIAGLFVGIPATPGGGIQPRHKKADLSWLAYVIGVGLVAMFVATKKTNHTEAGALAPIPVQMHAETNGIRLLWQAPPLSNLTLLKYQIQRSYNGGAWQYIDQGQVGAGLTQFFDENLVSGEYRYRIAAVYTDQSVSAFATFTALTFTAP